MSLQQDHRQEQRRLALLNVQELAPSVGLFLWCGWKGLQATTSAWAWFAAAAISLGVGSFLLTSSLRQRRRERSLDDTARGELERSLSQNEHRAWLYRNVAWWYLLPITCAIVLILVGSGVPVASPATAVFFAVGAAGFAYLYRLNRKLGREQYEPNITRLSQMIADLG